MRALASQITSLTIVYSSVYSRHKSMKAAKLRVTGFVGNSPVTGEFPAQRASNTENISIWWRHHVAKLGKAPCTPSHSITRTFWSRLCEWSVWPSVSRNWLELIAGWSCLFTECQSHPIQYWLLHAVINTNIIRCCHISSLLRFLKKSSTYLPKKGTPTRTWM